jgi:DNA modification methylase
LWKDIPRIGTNRIHPTEKPVALYKQIIENASKPGDLILDPYGGSGSSAEAALELNRNILVYELDPEFKDRIDKRIADWRSKCKSDSFNFLKFMVIRGHTYFQ